MKKIIFYLNLLILFGYASTVNAWWNCNWTNRTIISITNNGTSATNYVAEIKFNSSNIPLYKWSDLDKDLRFVDSNDSTLLNFFVMPRVASTQEITVWVQIPSLPIGTKNIYLYYGNSTATSISNPVGIMSNGIRMWTKPLVSTGVDVTTLTRCANENQTCTFTGTKVIKYGANGTYASGVFTNSVSCSNGVFGDPLYGVVKACYVEETTTTTSTLSYSSWLQAFNAAPNNQTGYGCRILTNVGSVTNNGTFGSNSNIHFSFTTIINSASSSISVTHGPDYGYGGGLYINGQAMSEKFGTNLYWGNSITNTTQILQGTASLLNSPYYVVQSVGSENGSDLTQSLRANRGAGLVNINTSNFTLYAPPCPTTTIGYSFANPPSTIPIITKTVIPLNDYVNGTSNPKIIPTAKIRYQINVTSDGGGPIDNNQLVITDKIPSNIKFSLADINGSGSGPVKFTDGSVSSGLIYSLGNITYSNNNGVNYTYIPVQDSEQSDANITDIKLSPTGSFKCTIGTNIPSFNLIFDAIVK